LCFVAAFALIALAGRFAAQNMGLGQGAGMRSMGFGSSLSGERIALIHIEGPITASSGGGGLFGGGGIASSDNLCDLLYRAQEDSGVKAVLLRINSPGGSAAASDEIYQAVLALRKSGKPVVVSMGDVAASGGYYIASAGDYIFANGATLTGSIGVIFELINWQELAKKAGVRSEALHAGEFKDIGSPWRDMTSTEKEMMKGLLSQVHDQFIHAVDEGRENLDEAAVRKLATGMVYTGEKAKDLGLVDELGGQHAAEAKVRELAKLDEDAPIEDYGAVSIWDEIFAAKGQAPLPAALAQEALRQLSNPLTQLAGGLYLNSTLQNLNMR
jgi:protease-4